jgi:hypothetical protein
MPAKDRREAKAERETSKVVEKSAKQKQQEEVRPARQPRGTSACCSGPLLRLGRCCNAFGTAAPRRRAWHAPRAASSDGSRFQTAA